MHHRGLRWCSCATHCLVGIDKPLSRQNALVRPKCESCVALICSLHPQTLWQSGRKQPFAESSMQARNLQCRLCKHTGQISYIARMARSDYLMADWTLIQGAFALKNQSMPSHVLKYSQLLGPTGPPSSHRSNTGHRPQGASVYGLIYISGPERSSRPAHGSVDCFAIFAAR